MSWVASPEAPWTPPSYPNIRGVLAVRRCGLEGDKVTLQEWAAAAQVQGKAHAERLRQQAGAAETEAVWAEREVEYWSEWVPTEEDLRDWDQA